MRSPPPDTSPSPKTVSASSLVFNLREARFHHLLNQRSRQRLVDRELNRSSRSPEILQLILERLDHGRRREKTAMVCKRREPYQHLFVPERRNPVADRLGGFGWNDGPNRSADFVQSVAGGFRDAGQVLIYIRWGSIPTRRRTAPARFRTLHRSRYYKTRPTRTTPPQPAASPSSRIIPRGP
jgi:hypothetical protein